MIQNDYINDIDCPVYFSYAWANDEHPDIEEDVYALCKLLDDNKIFYKRNKENLRPYCWSVNNAENEIGNGSPIIVVLSERYLKSLHCMHEWHLIREKGRIWDRVFPVLLEDAQITKEEVYDKVYKHFESIKEKVIRKGEDGRMPLTRAEVEAVKEGFYIDDLNNMYRYFKNCSISETSCLKQENFASIIKKLKNYFENQRKCNANNYNYNIFSAPHFPFPGPENLLSRTNEEQALFNSISKSHILNLVGVGGSGKSSLAFLCLNKYKEKFNEIVYVVVNNNFEEDFVEQINKTLKLEFEDEEDSYSEIIVYLQENYKSEVPNLLVFDINKTFDEDKNNEIINAIIKDSDMLSGWKFLILSREIIDIRNRIAIHNLNDKNDFEFLKRLFFSKVGSRYNDFGDFEQLFKMIYCNPLLTEQLGIYLKKTPKVLSIDEIKAKLYGDSFKEKDMQGKSAERHDETIVSFLKKLINIDDLSDKEKMLLRYFVLWQTDYIKYDLIADLLKGVFESEDELIDSLTSLAERSILTTNEGKTLSYKLHGLLAASLREQIDVSKEDYSKYMGNIERIIEYCYYDFMPYVDCIGNSLCEYDITTDYFILWNVALKYYDTWKASYSERLYNKAIEIRERLPKDNPEYQNGLASAYNNLASLQSDQLGNYKSAEKNYNRAIEIRERLPKDTPEYQNGLASVYNNLASLQSDQLGNYKSAEKNYNRAIEIRERLPKDNPEYQNGLAMVYNNLASLQSDQFGDYESAKSNYKKVIRIFERLPIDNPEYQNGLANAYTNLASLQSNQLGDYESAELNYKKAIEILERLPKDNPEYQNGMANAYTNLAGLQSNQLGDCESAELNYNKAIGIGERLPKDNPEYQNDLAGAYFNLATLQQIYMGEYQLSESNYIKAIENLELLSKDNPEYQNDLAWAYNNLANLQQDHLGEYPSAESNYKKAIGILELLLEDNPEYQNDLASAYNNLALLQQDHLGEYPSAESNYKKAIVIRERLPKDNPEYQNDLASAYNNLALLEKNHLGEYPSAESNYKKAIGILERIPEDNPEYQNGLASLYNGLAYCYSAQKRIPEAFAMVNKAIEIAQNMSDNDSKYLIEWINYKHSLAEIHFDNNEVKKAKEILDEIKPLVEKCLTENPNDSWAQTVNNEINELLEKCS